MVYDLFWWHVCHCWGMLWAAFDFDLHEEMSKAYVFTFFHCERRSEHTEVSGKRGTLWDQRKKEKDLKSSSSKPSLCPLLFQLCEGLFIPAKACPNQSFYVVVWYCGFLCFYLWFQTGNAWTVVSERLILTPQRQCFEQVCFVLMYYIKLKMYLPSKTNFIITHRCCRIT